MVDLTGERRSELVSQEWLSQAPKVSDALKKGITVSVATWSGQEVSGVVCDREPAGLLLEVRESDDFGYTFLPWSSIEQVKIQEIAHRRVKFIPS